MTDTVLYDGIPIIGFTKRGRPIPVVAGGAEDPDDPDEPKEPDKGDTVESLKKRVKDLEGDVEKWKGHSRRWETRAKDNQAAADRLKEAEDADKTSGEQLAEAKSRAEKAERDRLVMEVAIDKGLTTAQARRLVGTSREELEKDADELLETFKPATETSTGDAGGKDDKKGPVTKPTPDLKGGGEPEQEVVEMDPAKLADAVPRGG
jgi:hypothetical protein